jgi:hypothetical protein
MICCLYYKPTTIVNDNSGVVNKLETSFTDDARVIIYDHHMVKVQATDLTSWFTSAHEWPFRKLRFDFGKGNTEK